MFGIESGGRFAGISSALLAALAAFFVAMAALASPAQADVLRVTNKKDSGPGSLRAAIYNADQIGDTITFAPNLRGTITLTSGDLDIYDNLTIRGPGAGKLTVNGNNSDGVFYIADRKTVRISGLTITEGSSYYGGGIDNRGNLTLINSVVRDNFAYYGGGGVYNTDVLTLTKSVVSGNFSDDYGGGIRNYYGTLTVQQSTISGNRAAFGGGIHSNLTSDPRKTTIANSTISGNSISSATGAGGGVYNYRGLTEITNSTITDNTAPEGHGGGVFSTDYATTEVFSTIIARNPGTFGPFDTFVSRGYNIIGSGSPGVTNTFNKPGDRVAVSNPGLGPLADNGGFTRTHALQSGSPAINTGSPNCPPPSTDQRGVKRPQGGRCDIGSFEFGATR